MGVHIFPVAKLAVLLVVQISRSIAGAAKQGAKNSPIFKKYVCLPPARLYRWCEAKANMWLLHLGQPVNIKVFNEAALTELGATLLAESIIFTTAAIFVLSEVKKSSQKEAVKEEARRNEMQELKNALKELLVQAERRATHINELTKKIKELEIREPPDV